jgi:hypothetical protein
MNDLLQQLKQYAELRLELFRLSAAETVIKAASSTAVQLVLGVFLLSSVLMAELALGLYLGEQSGRWSLGFMWMAAGNLLLFFMAVLLKKPLLHSIQNGLSKFVKKP